MRSFNCSIEFLEEQKEKLNLGSESESESEPITPTENKEEKNFFMKGVQKLMDMFKNIF